jgi:putative oxidoreductase
MSTTRRGCRKPLAAQVLPIPWSNRFLSALVLQYTYEATWSRSTDIMDSTGIRWTPRALSLLRLVTGYLYLQHGTAKLLHVPHLAMFDQLRVFSLDGFAGMLEIVGSLLILLGLFTCPVAFILSGEMAVAYFVVHAGQGNFFMPALNGGEEAILYCFIFLFLAAAGGGSWSIDALLARK